MKHLDLHNQHYRELHKEFTTLVTTKGYSSASMYSSMAREFFYFLERSAVEHITLVKVNHIVSYYEFIRERPNARREGGLSESMIRHQMFCLRLLFDYLLDTGEIESSPARLPKFTYGAHKQRQIPDTEEIKLIYSACENKRDRALISVGYGCGLRRSEIVKLNLADVNFQRSQIIVRDGKGGKYRTVPLSDKVLRHLKEYVIYERAKYVGTKNVQRSAAFFVGKRGERWNGDKMNKRLKEIITLTKNQKLISKQLTLHCLRHAIATHLLDNGADMEFVQALLGHSYIDTVHIYTRRRKQKLAIKNQFDRHYANTTHL